MHFLLVTLLLSPPLTTHLQSTDTGTLIITNARINDGILEVTLSGDIDSLRGHDLEREDLINHLLWSAREIEPSIAGIQVYTQDGRLLSDVLRDPREEEIVRLLRILPRPPLRGLPPQELPYGGSLIGKTIVLSPGHGWTYYDSIPGWSFQRPLINMPDCPTCLGIIEDLSNAQIVARYLIPHLLRAGATVWSVRERDFSESELIVDEDSAGVAEDGAWSDGNSPGGYGDDYRVLSAGGRGAITYPLEPEQEGVYWVSVWYVEGNNRVRDALFSITHLGGTAEHRLDQTGNGSRWIHLGAYRFAPGAGGRLRIAPGPDARADEYLIADAVRLGGGFDQTVVGGEPADKPRWMMNALLTLAYFGLPESVSTGGDVTVRPAFAEWQGADAYLSLHSNAGSATGTASGTSTYRYNCGSYPDHSAAPDPSLCDDPPGSDALQRSVHLSIVNRLRDHWDPEWRDRGALVANFGEMRVLDQIPGALVESAFHDGVNQASAEMRMPDNQALQDPRFRHWLGFALYAGLAEFFDPQATLLPAVPPESVYLVHDADSGLHVGWDPVEGAEGYRVRYRVDGLGLGEGIVTGDLSALIEDIDPGQTVAVRVSALNAGGEGPPSELLVARYRGNGAYADVLLVSGFDRQDAYIGDFRNRRDQAWAHAEAIAAIADRNIYFDCASNESVIAGAVPLESYQAVIWILGEESSVDETFDDQEQSLVTDYLQNGGLMATGAEIGWDLVELGLPKDQAFFADTFDATYLSDDAETSQVSGMDIFAGLSDFGFDDGNLEGAYPAEYPDVLDGQVVLEYGDGRGAGVISESDTARTLLLGFPFETITSADSRRDLMDLALQFLMPDHTPDDFDSDGLPDDWEYENETGPRTPSADDDPDDDGKTNLEEYQEGTDPQVSDKKKKDGCGCSQTGGSLLLWPLILLLRRRRR
jgi:N-acetylmuramoyl-L-alanine amidase